MKSVVFNVVLLFAIFGLVLCDSKESSEEIDEVEELQNIVHEIIKKFNEGGEGKDQVVTNVTDTFDRYCPGGSQQIRGKAELFFKCIGDLDEDNTYCYDLEHGVPKCFTPLVELFEACLPTESKTLPAHIVNTIKSVFTYLCTINGEHIFELANFCVFDETEKYKKCEHKVKAKLEKFDNKVPSRDEICSTFTSMRPCFVSHVEEACKHPVTKESYIGIYDAFIKPCVGINTVVED